MDENIVMTENISPVPPQKNEIKLVDIQVNDENTALNVIVSFLGLAQKRGVFSFDESVTKYDILGIGICIIGFYFIFIKDHI